MPPLAVNVGGRVRDAGLLPGQPSRLDFAQAEGDDARRQGLEDNKRSTLYRIRAYHREGPDPRLGPGVELRKVNAVCAAGLRQTERGTIFPRDRRGDRDLSHNQRTT